MTNQITENSDRNLWRDFLDVLEQLALDADEVQDDKMKELLRELDVNSMEKLICCTQVDELHDKFPDFPRVSPDAVGQPTHKLTDQHRAMVQFVVKKETKNSTGQSEVREKTNEVLMSASDGELYGLNKIDKIDDLSSPCDLVMKIILDVRSSYRFPAYATVHTDCSRESVKAHMEGFNYSQEDRLFAFHYLDPSDDKWKWEVMGFYEEEFLDQQNILNDLCKQTRKRDRLKGHSDALN